MKRELIDPTGLDGDVRIVWDTDDKASVEVAEVAFNALKKKYPKSHFVVVKDGAPTMLKKFDPSADGQLLMIPIVARG